MEQHLSPPGPHPQQQRGRDDSSSGDSAISMQSLNDSLPQHADLKHAANPHAAAAAATAASSSVNSSNNSTNATAQQEYLEDAEAELRATAGGDHQYEDALCVMLLSYLTYCRYPLTPVLPFSRHYFLSWPKPLYIQTSLFR
jgi:microcystin-dependent protein